MTDQDIGKAMGTLSVEDPKTTAHPSHADVEAFINSILDLSSLQDDSSISPVTTDHDAPPNFSRPIHQDTSSTTSPPISHIILAPSLTGPVLSALTTPPTNTPTNACPLAFLIRPATSSAQSSLPPYTTLLSNSSAFTANLTLSYNTALAHDFGILPQTIHPLLDPSPHRRGQRIGLIGAIDPEEAGKYRFQSPTLKFRLQEMAGRNAPVVNRVSDVMRLCVGVSEDGMIGVFDFTGETGGVASTSGKDNDILEEEEEDEESAGQVTSSNNPLDTFATSTNNHLATPSSETTAPQDQASSITALVISRTFDAATVAQAHTLATKHNLLANDGRILFVTAQPRQAGLEAAKQKKMLVMCVTTTAANFWGLWHLGRKLRERWPELSVGEVLK